MALAKLKVDGNILGRFERAHASQKCVMVGPGSFFGDDSTVVLFKFSCVRLRVKTLDGKPQVEGPDS